MLNKEKISIIECKDYREQLIPKISELIKAGHILVIKNENRNGEVVQLLKKAGYSVDVIEIKAEILFDYNSVCALNAKEQCRLVLAIGDIDCTESAKVVAAEQKIDLIIIPDSFSALVSFNKKSDFFLNNAIISYYSDSAPKVLIFEDLLLSQKGKDISVGLGYLLAHLVWAVDNIYEDVIHNKGINKRLANYVYYIKEIFGKLNGADKTDSVKLILASTIETVNIVTELNRNNFTAICLAWAILLYKKQKIAYTNYNFIAAYSILELYRNVPYMANMLMPPTREKAFIELQKCCGLDYANMLRQTKIGYYDDFRRRDFITADYLDEFKALLKGDWLKNAAKQYRRLYGNSGFGINKIINSDEITKLLALSSEMTQGYPLLKHINLTGLLERYL